MYSKRWDGKIKPVPYLSLCLSGLSEPSGRKLQMQEVGIFSFRNLISDRAMENRF
jgi:hypothetical protein